MAERVEYGTPQVYMFKVNSDGNNDKETVAISAYDDVARIVTVAAITSLIGAAGDSVVFHEENENNYGFGKLISATEIELAEDSKEYFIESGVNLTVYAGMGVASFDSAEISNDQTGQDYRGTGAFSKESITTDADMSLSLTDVVFNPDFVHFINGYKKGAFGGGSATTIADFDVKGDKEIRPNDISVIAIKRRIEDDDLWEEFYLPRVKTGDMEIPTTTDSFTTQNFTFNAMTKSLSNDDIMTYNVQV